MFFIFKLKHKVMKLIKNVIVQISLLCLIINTTNAQTDTLKHFISGSIQFDVESYQSINGEAGQKRNSWNLYSGISWYFVLKHHWILGVGLGTESNYQKSLDNGIVLNTTITKTNSYGLEASLRHVKSFSTDWSWFTQFTVGGGLSTNKTIYNDDVLSSFSSHLIKSEVGIGINYKFHKHWSVEVIPLQLVYRYSRKPVTSTSSDIETDSRLFFNGFTNGVNLSFNYHY